MFQAVLLLIDLLVLTICIIFTVESSQEKEIRAPKVGFAGVAFHLVLVPLILLVPLLRIPIAVLFGVYGLFVLVCLIPGRPDPPALKGTMAQVVGNVQRVDERDIMFARVEGLKPGTAPYQQYYEMHPHKKEYDDRRRAGAGFPVGPPGAIDQGNQPTIAMTAAAFHMCRVIGPHAVAEPQPESAAGVISPERAADMVKNFALHAGADLVGICQVNPLWAYSHRGEIHYNNWDEWGKQKPDPLPYAVVFAVQMNHEHVSAAPHTPTLAESATQYCRGEYVSTILAQWFAAMGYHAVAHHFLHYDLMPVPLAVDAGLGELGRLGYLIGRKFGPRIRVFATTTDMPLTIDSPISIGVDEFCSKCRKCATSCPSRSIPLGDKVIQNGVRKWKLNEETCYEFWGKVGTDCAICMAVCPFSRPDTRMHRLVRWFVTRSPVAQVVFPSLDNIIYGRNWRSKKVSSWINYDRESTGE
jgi:reductive dehalogenase